jgi:hypothetical protein
MLPNLRELDISYMKVTESAVNAFAKKCPNLEVFRWNGSDDTLRLTGKNLAMCKNLKEIYLEDSRLYYSFRQASDTPFLVHQENSDAILAGNHIFLCFCASKLERVSIKGCKWYSWDIMTMSHPLGQGPDADIPQDVMVKFVQNTPTLRWFRSDLSAENVHLLQAKCPNVIFC